MSPYRVPSDGYTEKSRVLSFSFCVHKDAKCPLGQINIVLSEVKTRSSKMKRLAGQRVGACSRLVESGRRCRSGV